MVNVSQITENQVVDNQLENKRDLELYNAFLAGDNAAFARLYSLYERKILMYCRHLTNNNQSADDVFQEVWIKIIRKKHSEHKVDCFRAFIFTVARNATFNHLRNQKRYDEKLVYEYDQNLRAENVGYNETDDLVNRALAKLPLVQREAFVMHSVLGYTFEEIAKIQGIGLSAVKSRAFRTRDYLRKLLSNWMALSEDSSE